MIEVRCIRPIGSYEVGDIVDITDGVLITVDGVAGAIISKDLGEGERILFVVDDAVDSVDKKIRVQAPESMAKYFTYETTVPDPNEPPSEVNCALTQLLESIPPTRTYSSGINTFRLVPASSSYVLEFATELNGITKAGAAIVNIEYYQIDKQSDGSYLVDVTADGTVQTILIRQQGCTSTNISPATNDFLGGRFHAYITDNEGEVTPPISGKLNVPVGVIMWDGYYDDYQLTPRNGISGTPYDQGINQTSSIRYDLTVFDELNLVPFYGEQNLAPENITIITKVEWNPVTEENDLTTTTRNVTCKFNKTQTAADKEIGFLLDAGVDFMAFNWYSPFDTPMGEGLHKFTQSGAKGTMKMCFISGTIGWNIPQNVDYITDCMVTDYYQMINGKPLIFINNSWISQKYTDTIDVGGTMVTRERTILQVIKDDYASKTIGGQLYVVNLSMGRDYPTENYGTHGMQCASIYCTYAVGSTMPRPHSELMADEIRLRNDFVNNGVMSSYDIIPTITTGFLNLSARTDLTGGDNNNYTQIASSIQMDTKINDLISFVESNQSRVPAVLFYAGTENHESGNPIIPTLAAGYNSVVVSSLNVAGTNVGVNRTMLDKIKQYAKI